MSLSEVMTIVIMFHKSKMRTFKDFYIKYVKVHLTKEFPTAVSYNRFVELQKFALMPLYIFAKLTQSVKTGIYYIDSTKLPVCNNLRIKRHRVFKGYAERGKTSTGWFFGFKLHLLINNLGEIVSFKLTPGNVDDRVALDDLTSELNGVLFGDRGYISKKHKDKLKDQGLELITKEKKGMKKVELSKDKEFLLSKRGIIETINDQLKNIFYIDHTRHRSFENFQANLLGGLIAYAFKTNKVLAVFDGLKNYAKDLIKKSSKKLALTSS